MVFLGGVFIELTGVQFAAAMQAAVRQLAVHRDEVDALNVFPVPDGDTGGNMLATLQAAVPTQGENFSQAIEHAAAAMLRAARGNSGVILALIFRGMAQAVQGIVTVDGHALAHALQQGSNAAYQAVQYPTEGTMLTAFRQAAKAATACESPEPIVVWQTALAAAEATLAQTPTMLPVLAQAGVVDAGGQGLVYMMQGMLAGFAGEEIDSQAVEIAPLSMITTVEVEDYTYCTEVLITRTHCADEHALRQAILPLGNSMVVASDAQIIKLHVHTNQPQQVLELAKQHGELSDIKIDNMRAQQRNTHEKKAMGFVVVANGTGLTQLFITLGADEIVRGGQGENPSAQQLVQAMQRVHAEHVFVLPNNKNIFLATQQAAQLCDFPVTVLPTHSIAQGVAAVLAFDQTEPPHIVAETMSQAAQRVHTGLVTRAARASRFGEFVVREGDIIGLENDELTTVTQDCVCVAVEVTRNLLARYGGAMVTIYVGEDATLEQAQAIAAQLTGVETEIVPGGQPLYYFILGIE